MHIPELTERSLRQLIEMGQSPCVSVYVPIGEPGTSPDEVRIRLKNCINDAERDLRARGLRGGECDALLKPLRALLRERLPRARSASGLAFFRASGCFETAELPVSPGASTLVADSFHVKPLLPLLHSNGRFLLLSLSQNEVRLLSGDRFGLRLLEIPDLPSSIDEALGDDDNDDQTLQFRTDDASEGGDRAAVFHGQVAGQEDQKERIQRFCQMVDSAVCAYAEDQSIPLIIAAAEPLPGLYRESNHYRTLHPQAIVGDPRLPSDDELRAEAWKIVGPETARLKEEALDRLREALNKSRATSDLPNALTAAHEGRIDTLFVNPTANDSTLSEGTPDAAGGSMDLSFEKDVNQVVVETIRHGGRVFATDDDQMPRGAAVAALYRY